MLIISFSEIGDGSETSEESKPKKPRIKLAVNSQSEFAREKSSNRKSQSELKLPKIKSTSSNHLDKFEKLKKRIRAKGLLNNSASPKLKQKQLSRLRKNKISKKSRLAKDINKQFRLSRKQPKLRSRREMGTLFIVKMPTKSKYRRQEKSEEVQISY